MKQLIEFIPIALFGGVYFWTRDIFMATMFLMGGIVLQLAVESVSYTHLTLPTIPGV